MTRAPAFQVYARDFLVDDTARLSLQATGAFIRLLCHQWIIGPLPNDVAQLAKLAGTTPRTFRPIWRELQSLFPIWQDDTQRANTDLEEKRLESAAYRQRQSELARRRWGPRSA